MSTLAGNKHLYIPIPLIGRVFPIFRQKMFGPNPSEMGIRVFIPSPTQKTVKKTIDRKAFYIWEKNQNTSLVNYYGQNELNAKDIWVCHVRVQGEYILPFFRKLEVEIGRFQKRC